MDAGAEGDVAGGRPVEVEAVRRGEARRVSVRRAEEEHDERPARDDVAPEGDVRRGDPPRALDRALPAHGLLDRRGEMPGRLTKAREHVGMLQERQDRGADQTDRGLRPGHEQQDDHRDQLRVAQEAVAVRRLHERAHEVRCGLGPPRRDQLADIAAEGTPGRLPFRDEWPVLRDREGVETSRHRGRPGGARRPVRLGNPEELADDGARQGLGQVRDNVHPAGRRQTIERGLGVRLDARAERLDGARRERPAHRVAEPRVMRRVAEEHRLPGTAGLEARSVSETAACAGRGRSPARPEVALEPLAPEPWVAENRRHVGVPREDPEPMGRAVDGILGPETRVAADADRRGILGRPH